MIDENSAAIDPNQWGGKENVRPFLNDVEIRTETGEILSTNIADVIGSEHTPEGYNNIRDYLNRTYPDTLLIELPAGTDRGVINVHVCAPAGLSCPTGTR